MRRKRRGGEEEKEWRRKEMGRNGEERREWREERRVKIQGREEKVLSRRDEK